MARELDKPVELLGVQRLEKQLLAAQDGINAIDLLAEAVA